jgi:serine/threonine protein kinase
MGIVSEHVAGGSLDSPAKPISRREVMQAVADAALGAHALHEAGIAHANITPSNILLGTRCAKLADPSLLAVLDPGRTTAGTRAGDSVDLTDPSILLGASPSRASDVWSLGATLHRLLTGQSLFGVVPDVGETEALRHVIVAPARLGGSLSPAEARVIAECVAEDPVERPLTAEALATRLRSLLLAA